MTNYCRLFVNVLIHRSLVFCQCCYVNAMLHKSKKNILKKFVPQFVLHSGGQRAKYLQIIPRILQLSASVSSNGQSGIFFDASFHSTSRWQHRTAFLEPRVTDCLWGLKSINQRRAPLCGKQLDVRVGKQVSVPFKSNVLSHLYRFDAMINICL